MVLGWRRGLDRQSRVLEAHKPLQRHDYHGGENTYPTRRKVVIHTPSGRKIQAVGMKNEKNEEICARLQLNSVENYLEELKGFL